MSNINVKEYVTKRRGRTGHEFADIQGVRDMLSGDWFVDPMINYSRMGTPQVLPRPIAETDALPFSFESGGRIDSPPDLAIRAHSDRGEFPAKDILFGTTQTTLTMYQRDLSLRLTLVSGCVRDYQIALHKTQIRNNPLMKLP